MTKAKKTVTTKKEPNATDKSKRKAKQKIERTTVSIRVDPFSRIHLADADLTIAYRDGGLAALKAVIEIIKEEASEVITAAKVGPYDKTKYDLHGRAREMAVGWALYGLCQGYTEALLEKPSK